MGQELALKMTPESSWKSMRYRPATFQHDSLLIHQVQDKGRGGEPIIVAALVSSGEVSLFSKGSELCEGKARKSRSYVYYATTV
jgi:hypothetical protein